ncbi:T9SS type A sorting domain-containing protein [Parabacteroides distasonis]|uniref:T9SS type A sorting domain-containing protein n=1 Tax=Parabacteroides distasonis TaxID=823 RepID=UPI0018971B63|nr:T9SS type A sorting domain-containing protein [Parabacteroides distasonis]
MKTILRGISRRLSLIAMVLCLCAAWPGHGLAWGMAGSAEPAGMTPGVPQGQTEREVRITHAPGLLSYAFLYERESVLRSNAYMNFGVENFTEGMAVRVQLENAANPDGIEFRFNNDTEPAQELENGGFWVPDGKLNKYDERNVELNLSMYGFRECTVKYTVSVYGSEDLSKAPLVSSTHMVRHILHDQVPRISNILRITGDLNENIPFTVNVSEAGFLQGQPAKIKIYLQGSYDGLSLSGQNLKKDTDQGDLYVLEIPSFSAAQFTLIAHATEAWSGTYQLNICDADGNTVMYAGNAPIVIPASYSTDDIKALEAIAKANPLNSDLQNFISNKEYLKDRTQSDGYNVGVTWNGESTSRVQSFFIKDYRTQTVTSMNLSALSGLEELRLTGTRLKSLDLSALTKLRTLDLDDNDSLTWFTVKLPNPLPEYFNLYGSTRVMAGTPVDNYNAYAAKGEEIDLSAYATVGGVKSIYTWFLNDRTTGKRTEATMPAVSGKEGAFVFSGKPGEYYTCEITNSNYGNWRMYTPQIKVARSSGSYSPADIAGLKKLAADNPDITQLKEFVDSKGWERENWNSYQDVIRTDWNTDDVGRLTHLAIWMTWEQKDTISQLDLSAFTELKYFECERYMNIEKLDVSKNTKLEHLHVYSKNLASLDLSKCPELQYFRFGTQRTGEGRYQETKLATLNLTGCSKLTELYLEHSPLASLDISSFKQLNRLEIEYCPNLKLQGFDKATNLTYLALPHTDQFADLIKNLPAFIRELYLQNTEYELPSAQVGKNLTALGLPGYVESFDLALYPNLTTLNANGSLLRYSALKNYRQNVYYDGNGRIALTSPSHPESQEWFENGDTIDLSSEAVIDGVETVFLWVNAKYRTEEKEALKPVPNRPGVFVLDSKEEKYGNYYCKMMNPKFCEITEINYRDGWQIETSYIHVETTVPQVFAESDVATLARIVDASNNDALSEWWNSGEWQTGNSSMTAYAKWNDENPRRLTELFLYYMGESFTKEVDLSALDKLEMLSLNGNRIEKLVLPKGNHVLRELMLYGNWTLSSLILSEYPSLERLDLGYTGLTACDLSNNKRLTSLFFNGTMIPSVEKNYPEIAAQLEIYGPPSGISEVDLDKFPGLKRLDMSGSPVLFSGVRNPRQLEETICEATHVVGKAHNGGYSVYGERIDLSSEATVIGTPSHFIWTLNGDTIEHTDSKYVIADALNPNDWVEAHVTNPMFPGWTMIFNTIVYTCDGDANLDKSVNVQDVTATVSYVLKDKDNMIPNFGFAEADVNYDNNVQIADVIGIANIIRDEPVSKSAMLRAEAEAPVQVELDTDNFLTMTSQVPVAGIYLELVGAIDELPLLGDAAKFSQACSLNGDTLRVIGYSLDGRTIPSGKSRILRMPAGVTLVNASFSDAKANSLRAAGDAIVTSNAPIEAISQLTAVSNYPNPFRGSTTFRYQLEETATSVTIHVFSANGALATVLSGLPGEVGDNQYTAALTLPAGVYYYRLTAKTGHSVKASNSNIFIIK